MCFTLFAVVSPAQTPVLLPNTDGHTGIIRSIAYLDHAIVSVSEDRSLRWWDSKTGELLEKNYLNAGAGANGALYALESSPNQEFIVAGGYTRPDESGKLYVIDTEQRQRLQTLEAHRGSINAIAISPDGSWMATGGNDEKVLLWNINGDMKVSEAGSIEVGSAINDLSFAYDRLALAIATEDKDIHLIELEASDRLLNTVSKQLISRHLLPVNRVLFSQDGKYLVSGGQDEMVFLYSSSGKFKRKIDRMDNEVTSISISADTKMLVVSTKNTGRSVSYSLPDAKPFAEFLDHDNTVYSTEFNPNVEDGNYVVASSGGSSNEIVFWNAINGSTLRTLDGGGSFVRNIDMDGSGNLYISQQSGAKQFDYQFNIYNQQLSGLPDKLLESTDKSRLLPTPFLFQSGKTKIKVSEEKDGRILSYCWLGDSSVVLGNDFSMKLYDRTGKEYKTFSGHTGGVRSIVASQDFLVSGGEDEIIHIWNLKDTGNVLKPFASLYISSEQDWVIWTSEGYYTSGGNGAGLFGWLAGYDDKGYQQLYNGDQFFSILYRPEEVQESLNTLTPVSRIIERKGESVFQLTKIHRPTVSLFERPYTLDDNQRAFILTRSESGYLSNQSNVTIEATVYDGGSGIFEISIFQNSKLIITQNKIELNDSQVRVSYDVDLVPGLNEFKIIATNLQKIESKPDLIQINYTGEANAIADLYVLNVGINSYRNTAYNLNYAYSDARAFAKTVQKNATGIFREVYLYDVYNEEATKQNIISKFAEIVQKAKAQDVFIFYYAGHGTVNTEGPDESYYLVPHDVTQLYGNSTELENRAISSMELRNLLADVNAQKQLVLLDACHSGGAVEYFAKRGTPEEKAIVQLARSSGTVLLSASGTQQYAVEFDELGHGVFTYSLIEALSGKADGSNGDGKITVNELKAYMEDVVPELSSKYGGSAQYPTGFIAGQDFPIGIVKPAN